MISKTPKVNSTLSAMTSKYGCSQLTCVEHLNSLPINDFALTTESALGFVLSSLLEGVAPRATNRDSKDLFFY